MPLVTSWLEIKEPGGEPAGLWIVGCHVVRVHAPCGMPPSPEHTRKHGTLNLL